MLDVERPAPCFCFYGIFGERHYCELHGGGVEGDPHQRLPAPLDAFEPHPIVLYGVGETGDGRGQ